MEPNKPASRPAEGVSGEAGSLSPPRAHYPNPILGSDLQLQSFLSELFEPSDSIELRAIPAYQEGEGTRRQAVHRNWLRPAEILERLERIQHANITSHIYFGVAPRSQPAGTKDAVSLIRSLWLDLDNLSPADLASELNDKIPPPTVSVSSGNGCHCYWRLTEPYHIHSGKDRDRFEHLLRGLYQQFQASDPSVYDVSRILRLPGFWNLKGLHMGENPKPCEVITITANRYPLSEFLPFLERPLPSSRSSSQVGIIKDGIKYISHIKAVSGQHGHNATFRAACRLRDSGLTPEQALAALVQWNDTNAEPPWRVDELLHKVEDAYRAT